MKVIFLDVDGVLNSDRTLYEYTSLEDDLIENLKKLVEATSAKLILSSSWRLIPDAMRKLMDKLDSYGMYLSGATEDGVLLDDITSKDFTPTKKYLDHRHNYNTDIKEDVTHDRGAEIFIWLDKHEGIESFVVFDDDIFDIEPYFKDEIIKTSYETGLTLDDVEKAIKILNKM